MDNYAPNSRKSKKETVEKAKVEKVVKGVVKSKRKSGFLSLFLSDDISDIKDYVIFDVLIPAAKKAISDVVTNGIDMMLYGETGRGKKSSSASKVSYRSYYDRDRPDPRDRERNSSRTRSHAYDDIILETIGEAEDVIMRLNELIDVYGIASVSDLYDLVGIRDQHTDNKYGWTNLRDADYVRVRDGYLLKFPRVRPID